MQEEEEEKKKHIISHSGSQHEVDENLTLTSSKETLKFVVTDQKLKTFFFFTTN